MLGMGETIAVLTRSEVGTDSMGEPVYAWSSELVDGALVRSLDGASSVTYGSGLFTSGVQLPAKPDGTTVQYRISFPREWTQKHVRGYLANARVALVERGMDADDWRNALRVVGAPDRTPESPLIWDMDVEVGRVDG